MHQAAPGDEIHIITGEFLKASVWLEYYDFVFLKNKKQKPKVIYTCIFITLLWLASGINGDGVYI